MFVCIGPQAQIPGAPMCWPPVHVVSRLVVELRTLNIPPDVDLSIRRCLSLERHFYINGSSKQL